MRGLAGLVQRHAAEPPRACEPKPSPSTSAGFSTTGGASGYRRLAQRCAVRGAALLLFCLAFAALVAATGAPPRRSGAPQLSAVLDDAALLDDMLLERTSAFAELDRVQQSAEADAAAEAGAFDEVVRSASLPRRTDELRPPVRAKQARARAKWWVGAFDVASFPEPRSAEERDTFEAFVEGGGGPGAARSAVVAAMGSMTARPARAFDALDSALLLKFVRWSLLPVAQREDSVQHMRSEKTDALRRTRATRRRAPQNEEGELILITVTFHAHPADNLTRSP